MKPKHDVIVVGAGPAGSTAARILAENGHHVLLLDRRKQIGVPMQCGGLLPSPAELQDMFPRSPRMCRLAKVPGSLVQNSTSQIRLRSPRDRVHTFSLAMNILDREKYDQYLVDKAAAAGVAVMLQTWVRSRNAKNEVRVTTPQGEMKLSARVVIGADGPVSLISQSLGNRYTNPERDLSLSLQHHLRNVSVDDKSVEMLFGGKIAPGGYGWIIPLTKSEARIGIGLRRFLAPGGHRLKQYLRNILQVPSIAGDLSSTEVMSRVAALIPMGGPIKKTASENCILVGDSAGLVMATNGGGIPTALASGSIAGRVVSAHLNSGKSLLDFERHWRYEMGTELETARASLRIADLFMRSDSITEFGMRVLGSRFLEPIIRCRMPLPSVFTRALVTGMKKLV